MSSTRPRIELLVLDLDGVITDGTVLIMGSGEEARSIHFHDLDAAARVRRETGLTIAILTGEDSETSRRIVERFGFSRAVFGEKDKLAGIKALAEELGVALDETCYVGDADRDVPALEAVAIGLAPRNATPRACAAADRVLAASGGRGAVAEAIAVLEADFELPGAGQ
jgi:3-deoxy-D-manno-octulosonate 8-phosphate phosphatase (KDO 8-P phosphatase)